MKSADELRGELKIAEKRERLAKLQCASCDGSGWVCDTTYDRTGVDLPCHTCRGTGLPKPKVDKIIADALAPYLKKHS